MSDTKPEPVVQASSTDPNNISDSSQSKQDPPVEVTTAPQEEDSENETPADQVEGKKKGFWAYFRTKEFYITLLLGWVPRL